MLARPNAFMRLGQSRLRASGTGQAFTLVELLVVIGIIALLISVPLPSLSKAREQSKVTVCLSNLRQMATASLSYAANNKGNLPVHLSYNDGATSWDDLVVNDPLNGATNGRVYHGNWLGAIHPYLKASKLIMCPSHPEADTSDSTEDNFERIVRSYVANGVVTWNGGRRLQRTSEIIQFKDDGSTSATSAATVRPRGNSTAANPRPTPGVTRWSGWMYFGTILTLPSDRRKLTDKFHRGGKQCMSFVDGHTEGWHWKDITCLAFGLESRVDGSGNKLFYEGEVNGYTHADRLFQGRIE